MGKIFFGLAYWTNFISFFFNREAYFDQTFRNPKLLSHLPGIEILDKSLPIFLHNKFHKFSEMSGITAGNFCLRPVIRVKVVAEVAPLSQLPRPLIKTSVGSLDTTWFGILEFGDWGSKDSYSVDIELGAIGSSNGWKKDSNNYIIELLWDWNF